MQTLALARDFHKLLAADHESVYGAADSANIDHFQQIAGFGQAQFEELDVPAALGRVQFRTLKALGGQPYQVYHTLATDSQNRIAQAVHGSRSASIAAADLYAQDSTMGVYRSMHFATAEQTGLDHFICTGTIIAGARTFCHDDLGHLYKRA